MGIKSCRNWTNNSWFPRISLRLASFLVRIGIDPPKGIYGIRMGNALIEREKNAKNQDQYTWKFTLGNAYGTR
jgi:hypothetical protein